MTYAYSFHTFDVDERGIADALGIDYDAVLATRELAKEERSGVHGEDRREIREAVDTMERDMLRQLLT